MKHKHVGASAMLFYQIIFYSKFPCG